MDIRDEMRQVADRAREASRKLSRMSTEIKNRALEEMAEQLLRQSGALIQENEKDVAFYKGPENAMLCRMFGLAVVPIDINLVLQEGELVLGNETFRILLVPGHSPGSIALYWPRTGALFSGDVIFDQNVGRTDFPGGDGNLLKQSITRLSELDVQFLFPGHMGMVIGREIVKSNFAMVTQFVFPYI